MSRQYTFALLLTGILAAVGCSAPAEQPEPAPPSDVPAADSGTSLGSIGSGGGSDAAGESAPTTTAAPTPAATPTPGAAATPGTLPADASPAEGAAQARVQAAKQQAARAQAQALQAQAAQCSDLAAQIRAEQVTERQAPSTSINEDIVAATLAKADKRIDRLQQQYESQGCPDSDLPAMHARVPQLPAAPGALPP